MRCWSYTFVIGFLAGLSILLSPLISGYSTRRKCRPLQIASCRKLGYNQTRPLEDVYRSMPMQELRQYIKLIDSIRCSPDALFFLCTVYSPVCFQQYTTRVLPCRSVCETVKRGCMPFVKLAGFSWPYELECQEFPEYNTGVCIRPSAIVSSKFHLQLYVVQNRVLRFCGISMTICNNINLKVLMSMSTRNILHFSPPIFEDCH